MGESTHTNTPTCSILRSGDEIGPVWAERHSINWTTVTGQQLEVCGCAVIHHSLQHIICKGETGQQKQQQTRTKQLNNTVSSSSFRYRGCFPKHLPMLKHLGWSLGKKNEFIFPIWKSVWYWRKSTHEQQPEPVSFWYREAGVLTHTKKKKPHRTK